MKACTYCCNALARQRANTWVSSIGTSSGKASHTHPFITSRIELTRQRLARTASASASAVAVASAGHRSNSNSQSQPPTPCPGLSIQTSACRRVTSGRSGPSEHSPRTSCCVPSRRMPRTGKPAPCTNRRDSRCRPTSRLQLIDPSFYSRSPTVQAPCQQPQPEW